MHKFDDIIGSEDLIWDAALDQCEPAAIIFDPHENRIYHYNKRMLNLYGQQGFELAKHKVTDLFSKQVPELVGFTLACMDQGYQWSDEFLLTLPNDGAIAVELFGSSFEVRGTQYIMLICFDRREINARRSRADFERIYRLQEDHGQGFEAIFANLERGNRLILDAVGEGIYGVDSSGATTFINPAAERMLGWRAHELVGRIAHNVFHYAHPDGSHYPIKCCPIYAAFQDGVVRRVGDEVFWKKDGSAFDVEYTSTPIKEKGKHIGAVIAFRDISQRRATEIQLTNALSEVENLKKKLELENAYLQDELSAEHNHKEIVGNSQAVEKIISQIELVAPTDANVLITGESGTGKELIARAIHQSSQRSDRPLIRVNCATIPRELFESEFFGHKKGAFTGAAENRVGRFELADGGTIFLDEVGELPIEQQAKLLRVLQEGQFERVGDPETRTVNVRLIAATNVDLQESVKKKNFREDLFFRLNVFPVEAAPLRERKEDIPFLVSHFVKKICRQLNKPPISVSLADIERLQSYDWPGNIRELENFIERAVILSGSGKLKVELSLSHHSKPPKKKVNENIVLTEKEQKNSEKSNIISALKTCKGKVSGPDGIAELMGVKPTTMYSRLKKYGINAHDYRS